MKIWVLSDLHLEYEDFRFPSAPRDVDACVVAGDVSTSVPEAVHWLARNVPGDMPVVYVPGNHEFYRNGIVEGIEDGHAAAQANPRVKLLSPGVTRIGGVLFVGATLWTDFTYGALTSKDIAWNMMACEGMVSDFRAIASRMSPYEGFGAVEAARLHAADRRFIEEALEGEEGPAVVVSHHAPHPKSVHPRFEDSPVNSAFVSDLTDVIERVRVPLWIHGHVHDRWDYEVGSTRVVCNPRGYGSENRVGFDPRLVVEVG